MHEPQPQPEFEIQLGPMDPLTAREIFTLLAGTIARALERRKDQLAA